MNGRTGLRMGDSTMIDGMLYDGLTCAFDKARPHMGIYGNATATTFSLSREEQDAWSVRSHERALMAIEKVTSQRKSYLWKYHSVKENHS